MKTKRQKRMAALEPGETTTTDNWLRDRLSIKGLRTCRSMEGDAFSVTLCVDGRAAAHVRNEGCGGPNSWEWIGGSSGYWSGESPGGPSDPSTFAGRVWHDYVALLPEREAYGDRFKPNDDIALDDLISEHRQAQQIARWSRKAVVFRLPDDASGSYRTLGRHDRAALTPDDRVAITKILRETHGERVIFVGAWKGGAR